MGDIDPTNWFLVATNGEGTLIMNPPRAPLTREQALSLVAWVATLAELEDAEIRRWRDAVEAT